MRVTEELRELMSDDNFLEDKKDHEVQHEDIPDQNTVLRREKEFFFSHVMAMRQMGRFRPLL